MKHNIKPILWILAPLVLASCSITLSSKGNSDTVASWDSTASAASAGTAVSVDTSVASVVTATSVSTGEYTGTIALAQDGSTFTAATLRSLIMS